jgi:hypothetical protein
MDNVQKHSNYINTHRHKLFNLIVENCFTGRMDSIVLQYSVTKNVLSNNNLFRLQYIPCQ